MVENPSANAENVGLIPGSGRFLGRRMATASNILDEKIPWSEEPGRL